MSATRTFLMAEAGGRRLALAIEDVAAVLPLPRLAKPPGAMPPPFAGFADVGGRATAVIAPAALLAGEAVPAPGPDAHLLLLARGTPRVALVVDRATGIEPVAATALRPVPRAASANGWLAAEIGEGAGAAHLVDVDRLLLESERRRLAALANAIAAREAPG